MPARKPSRTPKRQPEPSNRWRSLIVGLTQESPESLVANPLNWKVHESGQRQSMIGVLDDVGWAAPVIVNDRTGNLIDGHMRVEMALREDEPSIPVLHIDTDEATERLILATYDPVGAMAAADREQLKALTAELSPTSESVKTMLQDLALRYRDGKVSEEFQRFLDGETTSVRGDGSGQRNYTVDGATVTDSDPDSDDDDGSYDDDTGESETEQYFPVTYSLTAEQRDVVLSAIKHARDAFSVRTSSDALKAICQAYLEDAE